MTKQKVVFKVHQPPDGHTLDLTLRVSSIANGYVIKAGGPPAFCGNIEDLKKAIGDVIERFVKETNVDVK